MFTQELVSHMEAEILKEVSSDLLMGYTREIAKEVRMSGSEEELRAFEYARQLLEGFGLQPEISFHNAFISLPVSASFTLGEEAFEGITHSMAPSVNGLQAEAVYVDKNKFNKRTNVKGKIVILEGNGRANPGDVKWLTELGAAGAVFVSKQEHIHEMIVSPVWGNPIPQTAALLPRIPVMSVNKTSGERIKQFIGEGVHSCRMTTVVKTGYCPIPTLTAEVKGQEEQDQFVLVSGHIDSWHLGAMDNGSANATMLEVARILSKHRAHLKRTVRFAFWSGHSHGRYTGSANYCDEHWEELNEHCILHVNVDSTGAVGATDVTHGHCLFETRSIAEEPIKAITGQDYTGVLLGRAGDHSFWGTGTPSLFMSLSTQAPEDGDIGGLGWWWHTPEDTLDKIDAAHLERDTQIYLLTVFRLLTVSIIPLNQLAVAVQLEQSLCEWQDKAGERLDLSSAIERTVKLIVKVKEMQTLISRRSDEDKGTVRFINESILSLSRLLMPLLYIKGSIYEHDLALQSPLVPKLAEIEQLAAAQRDSSEYHLYRTCLLRKRNEINDLLKRALEQVDLTIGRLS